MLFLVALQYPNCRTHESVLDRAEAPTLGTEFEMYGHTWRVTVRIESPSYSGRRRRVNPADEPSYLGSGSGCIDGN